MTENRCIEVLKKMKHMFTETCAKIDENTALDMAVEAIKENQQYRAIGTVEELQKKMEELERWHTDRINENIKNPFAYTSTLICHNCDHKDDYIEELESEIEEYRAIGLTPKMVKKMIESEKQASIQAIFRGAELELYQEIGTIDEFKALKEKNEPKKILYRKQSYGTPWLCPYCEADQIKVEFFSEDGSEPKEKYTFCWQCGTRIDWSE